jgi:endonuclease YncB( thermonuclease family)
MSVSSASPHPASNARSNRRLFLIVFAVVVVGLSYGVLCMFMYNPNYVTKVYDADRIMLKSGDGVVLTGIECPPVQDTQVGEPGTRFTEKRLLNRYIRIESDVEPMEPTGWIRGYVFFKNDGQEVFLNEELLRNGFGRAKPVFPNVKYRDRLEAAESEARSRKIGVWSPDYKPPGP